MTEELEECQFRQGDLVRSFEVFLDQIYLWSKPTWPEATNLTCIMKNDDVGFVVETVKSGNFFYLKVICSNGIGWNMENQFKKV